MDLCIRYIPHEVNTWTVTRAIASVLHSEDFAPIVEGRLINFRVKLNPNPAGGIRNDGTGLLTLPTEAVGIKFLAYIFKDPIRINKKKLSFKKADRPPPEGLALTLKKTPYVNPDIEEASDEKVSLLDTQLRVTAVQFGIFFQRDYEETPLRPRTFSVEWESKYDSDSRGRGQLSFDYDRKLIRITLENELTEDEGYTLIINFASIQKIGTGYDGPAYICFDTLVPPMIERFQIHRPMTGRRDVDFRKFKQRVGFLSPTHAPVAPYARHLRVVLFNNPYDDVVGKFRSMCLIAGLSNTMVFICRPPLVIEALRLGFFSPKRIYDLHKTLSGFDWPVAFQLESLLHNGLLNTDDMDLLIPRVRELSRKHARQGAEYAGDLLRRYNEALQLRPAAESPLKCYHHILATFEFTPPASKTFRCHHVTFTPTRMLLEGPYSSQSNRVIRQYRGYEEHFLRVDFRDEDRLQYRWDREVDGASFLTERVGKTLKNGFELAGRQFEFLAYSSSALRDHAVWFMNPFDHPKMGWVNAESIRSSLGNFEGTKLSRQPSKFAARLAQAFTATDPSVDIRKNEWDIMPDLGKDPYLFTDGVGTISKALGDRIWAVLCKDKRNPGYTIQPSAYQIRFLGFKGVVAVDEQLDKRADGIQMRLRPSMKKFDVDAEIAPLEIAQAFEAPNTCYLNRPLVMVLEDIGVRKEAFQELQDNAVADAKTIDDSISKFYDVLASHHLGSSYRLREILGRLRDDFNMDLTSNGKTIAMDTPFLRQVRQVAMTDILRDIKHSARIPVPNSYLLVGVADEGPAYVAEGHANVFCLSVGEVYVCVQSPNETKPTWLTGNASISRSPVVHPGDVQRVRAIGKPPDDKLCLFRNLVNVVVLPSIGDRSLASCLGGGDVDGDLFAIIFHDTLMPIYLEPPANYEPLGTLELDRESTVEDICDFIVEYINSDVLGLLSDRFLVIADQSSEGIFDSNCLFLAELCSQAVDYPKQGIAPDLEGDRLPRTLIRCKPDWHAAEVVSPRQTDYYESSRALGHLFRSITLEDPTPIPAEDLPPSYALYDPISVALLEKVQPYLQESAFINHTVEVVKKLFQTYCDELRYICATHTISNTPGVRLLEAEIVVGTILAKCSQKRWRKERIYRMRLHTGTLVLDVQHGLLENPKTDSISELVHGLGLAWNAWDLSLRKRNDFGANSFGLIALNTIFDCLKALNKLSIS
ncbi:hypothetical protein M413DRAFT_437999 [Hebeloma cylindrosporum]|uniref:RNA-dependent RNA polymerase n=1 Tax=Hebeloma cylindrosporum TaxID=76867 RepID=A0A0C3CYB2_HEBCY|nr:hypothetical protein M413DRAFT_437999 [Hebeloma cylindrosporum h7]